jgi:hypothetical protein
MRLNGLPAAAERIDSEPAESDGLRQQAGSFGDSAGIFPAGYAFRTEL